jgi:hypothetical protein
MNEEFEKKDKISILIKKRRSFSAVPDDILTNTRLSELARICLAYLIGRPDGWEIHVWQVRKALKLTEARWASARRELIKEGYFMQKREKGEGGKWIWRHEVRDEPLPLIMSESSEKNFEPQLQTPVDPLIVFPLLGGDEFEIYQPLVDELASLYPSVNVLQEFRNMKGWLLANPKNRKTKAGIARFYTAWLAKKQDRAGSSFSEKKIGDKLTKGKWGNFEEKNYREGVNSDGSF